MIPGMTGRYLALAALATVAACARPQTAPEAGDDARAVAQRDPGAGVAGAKSRPGVDAPGADAATDTVRATVVTGVDVLAAEGAGPLAGLRVGLITNHTGVTRDGRSAISSSLGGATS